ncbi:ERG20 farnesyl diphosphate synthase [Eremomyces bilateralis CBS 781.70]|uniref:ERG20 farnesyl diphosphate synthase n=1 Tax=Eremomyces bilateralis CBS 781.70 TaxID=1392243 RepID=A0A6G1FVG6_9PEZI|nr:ERG20 farnesyl diphosphate synthase [Eremomyces bilateralis CBS 781.70]KAF1809639.1 ERG20 farnesyl diphosphate synthase [Eremomyces bilateralis CBS 781.70]
MPTTRTEFETAFQPLVEDMLQLCRDNKLPDNARAWYEKNLLHNTMGGKYNRGMSVIDTSSILLNKSITPGTPEYLRAGALGWMIELLQAFFLVSDDIMDSSKTRRGSPCWYLMPTVGMIAINDAFMLEGTIYMLLKKHFRQEKCYTDLLELFHEVTFQTELGQQCDLLTAPEDHVDLDNFSLDKYFFIVRYKTAFYSFYLPVALALHYCGVATEKNLQQANDILIPMGEYFQVQDDYLDAFADPEVLGKIGTDIQDNKCSWLVNQALKRATPEQRQVLDQNYGRKDAVKEKAVRKIYADLKLEAVYHAYEEETVSMLRKRIADVDESEGLKKEVFEAFLGKIYKRTK